MRKQDLIPVALLGGVAVIIVVQAVGMRGSTSTAPPLPESPPRAPIGTTTTPADSAADSLPTAAAGVDTTPGGELVETLVSSEPAPQRDLETLRTLIRDGAPGTYLLHMLVEHDSLLMRWPDRRMNALRVWIDRDPDLPNWDDGYPVVAERVFEEWQRAGFPLRFDIVRDSADTEIRIRWITAFDDEDGRERLGMATKARDQHGWIRSGDITIATHDRSGRPLPATTVAGAARHEVGHVLGLGHSPNASDVMFAESRTTSISAVDRATLRLLYILPPGTLK